MTEEQQRAINIIACLTLLHGRPPALAEIAEVLGVTKVAVFKRLHWLEKKGLWRKEDRSVTELGLRSSLGLTEPEAPTG
ncbi:MAG: hypothetical protein ACJ8B6_06645 [Gemmatimonadales bacterium]